MTDRLIQATAPRDAGAAFSATRESGFALLTPLTPRATAWLQEHLSDDATWAGDALVIELRYFRDLADAIIEAGFLFERDAYVN